MLKYTQAKECINELGGRYELEKLLDQFDEDVIEAALECGVQVADIEEAYQGNFNSDREFAMEMADQLGSIDNNASWPNNCIDWEFAAKELMYDYSEHNGHYFRNL